MLNATSSKDNVKRVSRRVTFRLSGDDFANTLCLRYVEHDLEDDGPLPELSRARILELVDEVLRTNADKPNWWQDNVNDTDDDEFVAALWKWADDLVRRKFPEFY